MLLADCCGAYPSCHSLRGGCTLDKSPIYHRADTERQTTFQTTSTTNLESPTNLTCMFLGCVRKQGLYRHDTSGI